MPTEMVMKCSNNKISVIVKFKTGMQGKKSANVFNMFHLVSYIIIN